MIRLFLLAILFTACSQMNEHELRFQHLEKNLPLISDLQGWLSLSRYDTIDRISFDSLMHKLKIPGISLAVIDNYEIVYEKQYGVLNSKTQEMVKVNTVFQSGSTTKLLALTIVLQSVEKGLVDLDTDINQYLTSWKMPEHESGKPVTLRLLMSHQAGVNRPGNGIWHEGDVFPTLNQVLNGEYPATSDGVKFDFEPGTKHQYSNHGYLIIQKILEDVYGKKYDQIVKEQIFQPLNLKNSAIEYPLPPEIASRFISGHDKDGTPSDDDGLHPNALAQGGWMTNPHDMAVFGIDLMKAIAGKQSKLLSNDIAKNIIHTERYLKNDFQGGIKQQGLGCFLLGEGDNKYFFHHGHNFPPGANAMLICHPKTGNGLVVMTNGNLGLYFALQLVPAVAEAYEWTIVNN